MALAVEQPETELVKGFVLTFGVRSGETISLEFSNSICAEQVLRGMVHSGYSVQISEQLVTLPESLKVLQDWENANDRYSFKKVLDGNWDEPAMASTEPTPSVPSYTE